MAVLDVIKEKIATSYGNSVLGHNFRRYGPEFEAYDYSSFVQKARKFYKTALESDDPDYSVVKLSRGRIAIDYKGEKRGIYRADGEPLAFFKPDYHEMGYDSRMHELEDFRAGKNASFI